MRAACTIVVAMLAVVMALRVSATALAAKGDQTPPPPPPPTTCAVSDRLVPRCGILWGAAAGAYSATPREQALRSFETLTGRPAAVFHAFHRGDELFPTPEEIGLIREPGHRRILFANWKVAWGTTWARVAAGEQDARIDRLAAHLKQQFPELFFLAIHHEPEDDVDDRPDSGMTAADYVAMFRHTVQRLRADGVSNAIFVLAYMGNEKWPTKSWWPLLYPGDDVVDWIALDSYLRAQPGGYHFGDFADLLTRSTDTARWPGYYTWATTTHPDKPFMLAEWGVLEYTGDPCQKAHIYTTVLAQLPRFPALKAMFYFDGQHLPSGDTRPDSSTLALDEFKKITASPLFNVTP